MYPYVIFAGLSLYDIFIAVGIFLCILLFSKLADHVKMRAKLQNAVLVFAVIMIVGAFGVATLTQSFYDYLANKDGGFHMTGSTFYGGFVGGVLIFSVLYFGVGHFLFKDKYHIKHIFDVFNCAVCSVTLAHGMGRIGCLMAGCCHGKATNSHFGIKMLDADTNTWGTFIPVQLYEAIFLFLLCAFLVYRIWKHKPYNLSVYLVGYGVWRFVAEYFRGDERGNTIVSFLSPSQLTAVLLVILGVGIIFLERKMLQKMQNEPCVETCAETSAETAQANADENAQKSDEAITGAEDNDDKA